MPLSSANAGRPVAAAAARALIRALPANVSPVSGGSVTSAGSGSTSTDPPSSRSNSRTLWELALARTSLAGAAARTGSPHLGGGDGRVLPCAELGDALCGEREQVVQVG